MSEITVTINSLKRAISNIRMSQWVLFIMWKESAADCETYGWQIIKQWLLKDEISSELEQHHWWSLVTHYTPGYTNKIFCIRILCIF